MSRIRLNVEDTTECRGYGDCTGIAFWGVLTQGGTYSRCIEKDKDKPVETRFYCENCGSDVPFNAEICPSCGKVFSAVKCPVCLFEGKPGVFLQGCPKCGYMSPQVEGLSSRSDKSQFREPSGSASGNKKGHQASEKPKKGRSRLFPRWVYSGGIMILLLVLLVLLITLFRTW